MAALAGTPARIRFNIPFFSSDLGHQICAGPRQASTHRKAEKATSASQCDRDVASAAD